MSIPVPTGTDNSSTPAPESTVGFKVSKPGYDASTTSGSNMIFDSSWPSLQVVFDVTVDNTITSSGSAAMEIPHPLKYPPFVMVWGYTKSSYVGPVGTGPYGERYIPAVDSQNIYITMQLPISIDFSQIDKIRVMAFNIDLSKDIDYTLAPGDTFEMPYDNNFGVKIVRSNKDITSKDMRDFSLHSRCQSPLIWAVKTQKTAAPGSGAIQYTNKTDTAVWVYGYVLSSASYATGIPAGAYVPVPYYAQAYPNLFTDGFVSVLDFSQDDGGTLVVLRDPMFAAKQQTVVF